jgi:YD repeat-containing protein
MPAGGSVVLVSSRALVAGLLSAALIAELPGSAALAASGAHRASRGKVAVTVPIAATPARVPVKEPARPRLTRATGFTRPQEVHAVRPPSGMRVKAPPMMRPVDFDRIVSVARQRSASAKITQPAIMTAPHATIAPPKGNAVPPSSRKTLALPSDPTASGTGINPWWRYQEQNVPGGGHLMVNVGTGNMLLQDDDMSIPHKGIALAFRRTYNSQSSASSLPTSWGNWQSLYGNGWTNTFDARLVSQTATIKSVYDIDGARYDYSYNGGSTMTSLTPGQHATMVFDGGCGWLWTKKSGTTYYFYTTNPNAAVTCPSLGTIGGYSGRLYQIIGRNRNTVLTFNYYWDNGDASLNGKINTINATTESGQTASLRFADFNGRRLLQMLVYPDNTTPVYYGYDAGGNLTGVSKPENNAAGARPVQWYGYQAIGSDSVLSYQASPRWTAGCAAACGSDGNVLYFSFSGTSAATAALSSIQHRGVVNPAIPDGTSGSGIQPGYPTSDMYYLTEYYTTGVTTPTYRDTDGHMTNWIVDGAGRPTQTQECAESTNQGQQCTGVLLFTNETWDANNNLTAEVDARNNETDYAYDVRGNTIAVGGPATVTSVGAIRPTRLYQYDQYDNVITYCDETMSNNAAANWTSGVPADLVSRCVASSAKWVFTFDNPTYQLYGRLVSMTAPDGFQTQFQYDLQKQGGDGNDYGLPTAVSSAGIPQYDGSTLTPRQTFWYDSAGNVRCYSKGPGTWALEFDPLGRQTYLADPDNTVADQTSVCGTHYTRAYAGTKTAYFPNGAIRSRQTPSQANVGVQATYSYDLDGNEISKTSLHGCITAQCSGAVTRKYYDGDDRLVELVQPNDPADTVQPWITRYVYDIGAGQALQVLGTTVVAHGNLYKTQEVYPSPSQTLELKGQAFDALDRLTKTYGAYPGAQSSTTTYDATPSTLGLISSKTDALGQIARFDYDQMGRSASVLFPGDNSGTPDRTFTYDPNGRTTRIDSAMLGTERTTYDILGRVTKVDEFAGGTVGLSSPAQLRYAYYPNGLRKTLSVTSAAVSADPLMSYAYRDDGARTKLRFSKGGVNSNFSWDYTAGGRVLAQSDPLSGTAIHRRYPFPYDPGPVYLPTQYGYDTGLSLTSVTLPVNGNFAVVRDAEGNPASYTSTLPSNSSPMTIDGSLRVSTRNETLSLTITQTLSDGTATTGGIWGKVANHGCLNDATIGPDTTSCDVRTGAVMSPGGTGIPSNCSVNYPRSSYTYDRAGRRTAGRSVQVDGESCNDNGWAVTWTYDAENHTTSAVSSNTDDPPGCNGTIRWSPHAHPAVVCGTTLHFDGDVLLFASSGAGSLAALDVERLGMVQADNSVLVNDRDYAGLTVMNHGANGYSAWDAVNTVTHFKSTQPFGRITPGSDGVTPTTGLGGMYNYLRPDGFESPLGTVQGTRVSGKDGWTAPDAFAGDVHDPMSQKPFMWNRNNPFTYSDPSGFDAVERELNAAMATQGWSALGATLLERSVINAELQTYRAQQTLANAKAVESKIAAAREQYPKLTGTQQHHVVPKYLGGPANGPRVQLPTAYHQVITNEFRSLAPYGQAKPPPGELGRILSLVYGKYPLP